MMKINPRSIVVDTTFLDAMYRLKILDKLIMLYSKVYIPEEVEKEFLSKKNNDRDHRFEYLVTHFDDNQWINKCNTYDQGVIELLLTQKGMHRGESEVIAQTKQLGFADFEENALCAIIDDKIARNNATNMSIQLIGTLKVLALFHFSFGILDYHHSVNKLRNEGVKYSDNVVLQTFKITQEEFLQGEPLFNDLPENFI